MYFWWFSRLLKKCSASSGLLSIFLGQSSLLNFLLSQVPWSGTWGFLCDFLRVLYKGLRETGQGRRRSRRWFQKSPLNLVPWGAQKHKVHHRDQKGRLLTPCIRRPPWASLQCWAHTFLRTSGTISPGQSRGVGGGEGKQYLISAAAAGEWGATW